MVNVDKQTAERDRGPDGRPPKDPSGPKPRWPIVALVVVGVLWLLVLGSLVAWAIRDSAGSAAQSAERSESCDLVPLPRGRKPAVLHAVTPASSAVSFGRTLGTTTREFQYTVQGLPARSVGNGCLQVDVSPFTRASGDADLPDGVVTTTTRLDRHRAVVDVTFTRSSSTVGPAGIYAGVVTIADPRVQRTDIPLTVAMSYPRWQVPVALFVFLLLPEFVYVWLLKGSFQGNHSLSHVLTPRHFAGYLFDRNGLIAVGTGTAAAFGILSATYFAATSWDGDVVRFAALAGSLFSAFVAAATGVAAAGADKATRGSEEAPSEKAASEEAGSEQA